MHFLETACSFFKEKGVDVYKKFMCTKIDLNIKGRQSQYIPKNKMKGIRWLNMYQHVKLSNRELLFFTKIKVNESPEVLSISEKNKYFFFNI